MALPYGAKTLPASGSQPVQVSASQSSRSVAIASPITNTATVYVGGDSSLTSANGYPLEPGEKMAFDTTDVSGLWLSGAQNDVVRWIATVA